MPTIETDDIEIDYRYQARGLNPHNHTLDILRVSVYVPVIRDWIDVTEVESEQLDEKINILIAQNEAEKEMEQ